MTTITKDAMLDLINAHAYHPYSRQFGWHLKGRTTEERYAEVQRLLAEQKQQNATFRAAMIAHYAAKKLQSQAD